VDECKPLECTRPRPCLDGAATLISCRSDFLGMRSSASSGEQGLTLTHSRAQFEDLRDASLTVELTLNIFGTHRRATLSYMGVKVSLS